MRAALKFGALMLAVAACDTAPSARIGPDGLPLPQVYNISEADSAQIPFRMLDSLNSLRQASGAGPVRLNAALNAAAATHARDMAVQNRPWHFGSDGSSPLERSRRVGYAGEFRGETISETYETELQTLAAWMQQPDTRAVLMDPDADEIGFAWFQENNGKIWWTLVLGDSRSAPIIPQANAVPTL